MARAAQEAQVVSGVYVQGCSFSSNETFMQMWGIFKMQDE